jgi:hypothetical protein
VRALWLSLVLLAAAASALPADPVDPAARMSSGGSASEYWDLTVLLDTGHRVVGRFLITNEGPGKHSAVSVGHVVLPDGQAVKFRNGRRRERWKLDEKRLRIDIGSSLLDLQSPIRTFEYDNEKKGLKIRLAIEAGETSRRAGAAGPGGYQVELLDLSARAEGTLWTRGMDAPVAVSGLAALTHTWMDESESRVALRRFDFVSSGEEEALLFHDLTTASGERLSWLAIEKAGRILYESEDLEVSLRGVLPQWRESGYPIPAALHLRNSELDARIELGKILVQHEPLEDLPQPLRFLLSFRTRPKRVWTDSPFEVKVKSGSDRSYLRVRGTGIASVTYLNPLPSPAFGSPQRTEE